MLQTEEVVGTFNDIAAKLPRLSGKRIHVSTLWRWATKGCRGVRLETRRLGGRYVTSIEAVDRFSAALAEPEQAAPSPRPQKCQVVVTGKRTPAQRAAAIEKARKELAEV